MLPAGDAVAVVRRALPVALPQRRLADLARRPQCQLQCDDANGGDWCGMTRHDYAES